MGIIGSIIIGALAGWIAGKIMRGGGFGFLINLLVGIVGGIVGGAVFGLLGLSAGGFIGRLIVSAVGASLLLWLISFLKKE